MNLPRAKKPFRFVTEVNLTHLTARTAKNLPELLGHLKEVPGSVIYYHTHHFLKQHQFLSPEPPNDFSYWVNSALQNEELAERLAAVDTVKFRTIRDLREKIIQTIQSYLGRSGNHREAVPGDEFRFMRSLSFILPTPYEVYDLREFSESLKKVSINSLYHHIFEARIRLTQGINDFSHWFETSLNETGLSKAVARMDPYTQTIESLRQRIIDIVQARIQEIENAPVG